MPDAESMSSRSNQRWEDIRAVVASVGDITPAGPIESIDYFDTIGAVLIINGTDYHRGIDAAISRKVH